MPKGKQTKKKRGPKKSATAKQVKETKALLGIVEENPEKKDQYGRPTVMTNEVIKKLEEAYTFGCTNAEAALYAGIGESTLDKYLYQNPEEKERLYELKESPALAARMRLVKAVAKNPYYALKYLERKKSDEFSIKIKQTFEEPEPLSPEEEAAIDEAFDENY